MSQNQVAEYAETLQRKANDSLIQIATFENKPIDAKERKRLVKEHKENCRDLGISTTHSQYAPKIGDEVSTGIVAGILQGRVVKDGPRRGRFVIKGGKKVWKTGQSIILKQQRPAKKGTIEDGTSLGTFKINEHKRLELVGTEIKDDVTGRKHFIPTNEIDESARIVALATKKPAKNSSNLFDYAGAKAAARAAEKIKNGTAKFLTSAVNPAQSESLSRDTQTSRAEMVKGGNTTIANDSAGEDLTK